MSSGESSLDTRPFRMQDGPPIPWFLADLIWENLYRYNGGAGQPAEVVNQRGGFGWDEVAYMWKRLTPDQKKRAREAFRAVLS